MRGALAFWGLAGALLGGALLLMVPMGVGAGVGALIAGEKGAQVGLVVGTVLTFIVFPTCIVWDRGESTRR